MLEIRWRTKEFDYHHKDDSWYLVASIVGIILIAIALWQRNLLFAIFIAVATVMVIIWGKQKPRLITYCLNSKELVIDKKNYVLELFDGFYVNDKILVLKYKNRFSSYLKINIKEEYKNRIKKILKPILKEINYNESMIDVISNWLKF